MTTYLQQVPDWMLQTECRRCRIECLGDELREGYCAECRPYAHARYEYEEFDGDETDEFADVDCVTA